MKPNRLWLAIASSLMASQLMAGEAVFYVTEDGEAVRDLAVAVNGDKKLVGKAGFVSFDVPAGSHSVELSQYGEFLGEFDFETASDEQNAEIQVEMIGGEALPEINVFTPGQEDVVALGQISGYLMSDDTGGAITGARVSVEGTEQGVVTDEDGFFSFELPRGEYKLLIADPNYGKRDVSGVRVMGNVNTGVNLNMSLDGDGVIEEVVAVGSYIPSTAVAQERDASAVLDSIGADQMSRFGDSSAASALKRVAGVTITGGKYVVARGLNERHTSIMLNGASLPSPDPTRRVVPLDIFPSTILDGISVQKTFTPNVYADSTGSAVSLKTKKFPTEFEGKFSASLGYVDTLTTHERELQQSEGLDVLGFGSDGDRALPGSTDINDLASNLNTEESNVLPDVSMELGLGDTLVENDYLTFGYNMSLKYSNEWSHQDRKDNVNLKDNNSGGTSVKDDYDVVRTSNDINLGFGLSFGLISGDHEYTSNTLLLRQTHAETSRKEGIGGQQDRLTIDYTLDWLERQFLMQQFTGDHYLSSFAETEVEWQVSLSQAKLENPDRRSYSFDTPDDDGVFYLRWSDLNREYNELTDDNIDFSVALDTPFSVTDNHQLKASYGLSMFSRSREAENTELGYDGPGSVARDYADEFNVDRIVSDTAGSGDTVLLDQSLSSGDYDAEWDLMAYYAGVEWEQFDQFKLNLGARFENSQLEVNTADFTTNLPETASLDNSNVFLSLGGTVFVTDAAQVRLAYYQTQNRPDFRELAEALYLDPETGDRIRGNSELESTDVNNFDIRGEYYFTDAESVSIAYFQKEFDKPIEKVLQTGRAVYSFDNGEDGSISGFELDYRKEHDLESFGMFVSGNLSYIDSEVTIGNRTREMQGQPDQLANLQIGLDDYSTTAKVTLVVNYQGESLYYPAQANSDDIDVKREPRTEVDINSSYEFDSGLSVKLRLKNLLDDAVDLTQDGANYRSYKKGREYSIGMTYNF